MRRARVLLADDHKMMAQMIERLLTPCFDVVGTAEDGLALVRMAKEFDPDVIVADISMPGLNGFDALNQIKRQYPQLKFIMLTGYQEPALAQRAMECGASAFLLKMFLSEELTVAIDAALSDQTYITPHLKPVRR
jgi:DNA-binding NarL/FixJ family response regulator